MYPFRKHIYATRNEGLSFKWVPKNPSCQQDGGDNTGWKVYANLGKVTDDVSEFPLDINADLCSLSGLPQDTKTNTIGDPDYELPIFDEASCPIPSDPGTLYSFKRDGSQTEGNPSFHIPYVNYIDTDGNPQTFLADMTTDICGSFYALSITYQQYVTPCD